MVDLSNLILNYEKFLTLDEDSKKAVRVIISHLEDSKEEDIEDSVIPLESKKDDDICLNYIFLTENSCSYMKNGITIFAIYRDKKDRDKYKLLFEESTKIKLRNWIK